MFAELQGKMFALERDNTLMRFRLRRWYLLHQDAQFNARPDFVGRHIIGHADNLPVESMSPETRRLLINLYGHLPTYAELDAVFPFAQRLALIPGEHHCVEPFLSMSVAFRCLPCTEAGSLQGGSIADPSLESHLGGARHERKAAEAAQDGIVYDYNYYEAKDADGEVEVWDPVHADEVVMCDFGTGATRYGAHPVIVGPGGCAPCRFRHYARQPRTAFSCAPSTPAELANLLSLSYPTIPVVFHASVGFGPCLSTHSFVLRPVKAA